VQNTSIHSIFAEELFSQVPRGVGIYGVIRSFCRTIPSCKDVVVQTLRGFKHLFKFFRAFFTMEELEETTPTLECFSFLCSVDRYIKKDPYLASLLIRRATGFLEGAGEFSILPIIFSSAFY